MRRISPTREGDWSFRHPNLSTAGIFPRSNRTSPILSSARSLPRNRMAARRGTLHPEGRQPSDCADGKNHPWSRGTNRKGTERRQASVLEVKSRWTYKRGILPSKKRRRTTESVHPRAFKIFKNRRRPVGGGFQHSSRRLRHLQAAAERMQEPLRFRIRCLRNRAAASSGFAGHRFPCPASAPQTDPASDPTAADR